MIGSCLTGTLAKASFCRGAWKRLSSLSIFYFETCGLYLKCKPYHWKNFFSTLESDLSGLRGVKNSSCSTWHKQLPIISKNVNQKPWSWSGWQPLQYWWLQFFCNKWKWITSQLIEIRSFQRFHSNLRPQALSAEVPSPQKFQGEQEKNRSYCSPRTNNQED